MLYGLLYKWLERNKGLTLHFVGIARPSNMNKSQYKLFKNINTESTMIAIETSLKPTDTISTLKELIKKTYSISSYSNDILILYSHHIITDNESTLNSIGITNNSLLTLAICDTDKIIAPPLEHQEEPEQKIEEIAPEQKIDDESESESESESSDNGDLMNNMFGMYEDYESEPEPVESVNELFGMFEDYTDSEDDMDEIKEEEQEKEATPIPPTWPRLGFDIITQENNKLVHKMPICGHEMNKDSLYEYILNTFKDSNNLYIKCPHSRDSCNNDDDSLCDTKWKYSSITDILRYNTSSNDKDIDTTNNKWMNYASITDILRYNTSNDDKDKDIDNKWMDYAKLELLGSRNIIQNECDVQKCPRCKTLYFKNINPDKKSLDEIKSVDDIENEFKFKCIFCPSNTIEIIEKIPIKKPKKIKTDIHNEDDIKEDIDGDAVNILFENENDSDSDDEEEEEDDDNIEAIKAISHMFDDDEPDFEEIYKLKTFNLFCWCCGSEWIDGHICDSSFKHDLVSILSMAETKKIGSVDNVPSIRCCPNCCQLLFHIDCCKHMQCRTCKTDFCFVCMKPTKDGNWQCGSHSSKCPVADRQNIDTLPDTIVITKKLFQLY